MTLQLGFSPCPNDTFVFDALVHGRLADAPPVSATLADIDVLNSAAAAGELDVVKVSCAALPWLLADHALLSAGGAVGEGCGPLVVSRDGRLTPGAIGVPGTRTTAYLLLRLWQAANLDVVVLPFDRIMPAVRDGELGAGLVIHESRFTYPDYGLQVVVDLGAWWESTTGLPIPLGAVVARRALGLATIRGVDQAIRRSVEFAWAHPQASRDYVRAQAQEIADDVIDAHIALYVTEYTRDLGEAGRAAMRVLFERAAAAGLVPSAAPELLAG